MSSFEYYWSCEPQISMHFFARDRERFTHAVETRSEWVWLAPEQGQFWFGCGENEGECVVGDWVLCPPKTALHRKMLLPSSFHIVHFTFAPHLADYPLSGKTTLRDGARLQRTFAGLRTLPTQEGARLWQQHALLDVFRAALWQKQHEPFTPDATFIEITCTLENKLATDARKKIDLAKLARGYGFSPSEFSRRFHAATGQTPARWVQSRRLEIARALLLDSDWTLDRIAQHTGFGSGFYLSRVWSQTFGSSPSHFRRTHRA